MRIAITGATGFVSSHLATRLTGEGHEVVGLARRAHDAVVPVGGAGSHSLGRRCRARLTGSASAIRPGANAQIHTRTDPQRASAST